MLHMQTVARCTKGDMVDEIAKPIKHSPNWGGRRPGSGRKPSLVKLNERYSREIDRYRKTFTDGMNIVAEAIPKVLAALVRKALDENDTTSQVYLVDRFYGKPRESVVHEDPATEKLVSMLEEIAEMRSRKALPEGSSLGVIEGEIIVSDQFTEFQGG